MISISAQVVGAERVTTNLKKWAEETWRRVFTAVERLTLELQAEVKRGPLSGGALNVRSGRLRRGITRLVLGGNDEVRGKTGDNVEYGRFWELGYHGVERVRAHARAAHKRTVGYTAKGRRRRKTIAEGWVRAHDRRVDQDPRPFLGPSLKAMRARVVEKLAEAMKEK